MSKNKLFSGTYRFWSKEYKPRPASLTLDEHFLKYLRSSDFSEQPNKCTKRKIRRFFERGLDILAHPYLVYAIHANCSKRIIEYLLDLGADPYMEDLHINGNNAMIEAIRACRYDIVELLIKHEIDINKITSSGQSPFHIACLHGDTKIFDLLASNGGNVHICDTSLNTPLHLAIKANHYNITQILLNYGANANAMNLSFNSPLFYTNNIDIAYLLIRFGADVNHRNANGDTPLHRLVKHKSTNLVKLLLNHQANPLLTNNQGRNPIDIARYHETKRHNKTCKTIPHDSNISDVLLEYSIIVKMNYHKLINTLLVKEHQEPALQNIIFNYIF